jgi:hypothetical protein
MQNKMHLENMFTPLEYTFPLLFSTAGHGSVLFLNGLTTVQEPSSTIDQRAVLLFMFSQSVAASS